MRKKTSVLIYDGTADRRIEDKLLLEKMLGRYNVDGVVKLIIELCKTKKHPTAKVIAKILKEANAKISWELALP